MQKLILLLTMSKNRSKQIFAKTKTNQIFSTNFATTYHIRVITTSENLLNRNMVSYKVALGGNIPIYNSDKNKIIRIPFALYKQSDFQDQTLSC